MINEFFNQQGSDLFLPYFETAENKYKKEGTFFLDEKYLLSVNREYGIFDSILIPLLEDARKISSDKENALYCLFVYTAMQDRQLFMKYLPLFRFDDTHDFLPLLCLIPFIPDIFSTLKSRGVPLKVISDTIHEFENCVHIYSKRYDKPGLNKRYFDFLQKYVDCSILNIGRLRFEMFEIEDPIVVIKAKTTGKLSVLITEGHFNSDGLYYEMSDNHENSFFCTYIETDKMISANEVNENGRCISAIKDFSKDDYIILARKGDHCLSVHIPDTGDFSRESCDKSYSDAIDVFSSCYPETEIKIFHCESWMMAPELSEHLKEGSRILSFASDYIKYPIHSSGNDVLNFVFYLKGNTYSELPEDSSLQRSLKKLYLSGRKLFEFGGIKELN